MKSNLDLARECGASFRSNRDGEIKQITMGPNRLDAFVERIRADAMAEYAAMTEKGAKAWVDELRGSDAIDTLPERVEIQAGNVQMMAWPTRRLPRLPADWQSCNPWSTAPTTSSRRMF